ncbi:hypothetical protein S40285_03889 [Stachybotrys chlorohalonatus IBT 40285]|uniref:Rhodopsin domain-containing protein n=1 Tax=Stachybotrys chlorohalonatus (strain IBT 40285) TaxID=1283841 RepID=A0A084R170_STAC4|nr:hypothetical protein S40285_03889 [Stachybotrys chlorohalonata IBT 40285]
MSTSKENRSSELICVNVIFLAASLISIILRSYVRLFMVRSWGLDDWLMALAAVFFTLYASFSTAGAAFGTGRHHADLEPDQIRKALMCWWFCYLTYSIAMVASKMSIGWLLLRITTDKLLKWIIYIAMVATGLSGLVFFLVTMFQCSPIPFFWDKQLSGGSCVNIEVVIALAYLYSSFSVVSDFIFAILPSVVVWKLQIRKEAKLLLLPLLAMGCVASCAVIARFPYLGKFREPDFLWNTTDIAIWSTIEQGLAITAGSLATLRPLLKALGLRLNLTSKPSNSGMGPYVQPHAQGKSGGIDGFGSQKTYAMSPIKREDVVEISYEARGASTRSLAYGSPFQGTFSSAQVQSSIKGNESEEELHARIA